ncbi:MAG: peptidyl-prolyl cis-trans isomerase [Gemmatimonadota bacterium]|jgi:peptidyl-prolyl cis-trans isomerase C|nr:peptidyl-prolyl cis-trans isomerase [Gemmatimonadota bacterium]MDP7031740.1 peptidyl-prolyl cis-trans isomerase [Gemmatimonadota bacterium]
MFIPWRRAALPALLLISGCSGDSSTEADDAVLVVVGGTPITESAVASHFAELPPDIRAGLRGPSGREKVLARLVEEELLYRGALDDGLEQDPRVAAALRAARRSILSRAFLDRRRDQVARVSEEDLRAFYDSHKEDYSVRRTLRVRQLLVSTREKADEIREQVVAGQLDLEDACWRQSDHPQVVQEHGLLPEWIRKGRAVGWFGNHPRFHEVVFELAPGEVSEVFETAFGFHVARIEEERPASTRPFEAARADILARMSQERMGKLVPDVMEALRGEYGVEYPEEQDPEAGVRRLFEEAQAEPSPRRRLALYEQLVEEYSGSRYEVEALFMIGFILREELADANGAERAFRRVVEEFPESDLAASARWLLSPTEGEPPSAVAAPPPPDEEDSP